MEVVANSYMPGDPRLIDQIVYELKSQGIFDQFRKECIADVDTKPAYQNLSQRVEGTVSNFLRKQKWRPDMNKNQVREQLRKNIHESGFLETGVERIVDQVVNPKINTIFLPKVEDVVYRFLGIAKPIKSEVKKELKIDVTDLLPTDLEAISPESDHADKKEGIKDDSFTQSLEDGSKGMDDSTKTEEDESPAFEPLEESMNSFVQQEDNSVDSNMSGLSGLVSHESNQSTEMKETLEVSSLELHVSQNSFDSKISTVTSDENTKMDISEESNSNSVKNIENQSVERIANDDEIKKQVDDTENNKKIEDEKKPRKSESENSKSDEKRYEDDRKLKTSDKYKLSKNEKEQKDEKVKKSHSKDKNYKSISRHNSSSSVKDKDMKSSSKKDRDSKDKNSSKDRSDKDKRSKEKPEKEKNGKSENVDKLKHDRKEKTDNRDKKEKCDKKDKKGDKKDKYDKSKGEKHDRDRSRDKRDKDKIRNSSSSNKDKERNKDKPHSSSSSSSKDKDKKTSNDSKPKSSSSFDNDKESKNKHRKDKDKSKKPKDDHYSSKEKKTDRRSTDRDSNDGSSKPTRGSSRVESTTNISQKNTLQDSSSFSSGSGTGDSGNSDKEVSNVQTPNVGELQQIKYIKPKFASNIHEAMKIMKIRKQLAKLEKQNQLALAEVEANRAKMLGSVEQPLQNGVSGDEEEYAEQNLDKDTTDMDNVQEKSLQSTDLSTATWEALEARLTQEMSKVISNSYAEEDSEEMQYSSTLIMSPVKRKNCKNGPTNVDSNTLQNDIGNNSDLDENYPTDTCNDENTKKQKITHLHLSLDEEKNICLEEEIREKEEKPNERLRPINKINRCRADGEQHENTSEDCKYFDTLSPGVEKNLQFVYSFINKLEKDVEEQSLKIHNNIPSVKRSNRKRRIQEVENNNKIKLNKTIESICNVVETPKAKRTRSNPSLVKTNKVKTCNSTDVSPNGSFVLPLSPAESEKSIDNKKLAVPVKPTKNAVSTAKSQRYSSEDLYKPRPIFTSSRRRGANLE